MNMDRIAIKHSWFDIRLDRKTFSYDFDSCIQNDDSPYRSGYLVILLNVQKQPGLCTHIWEYVPHDTASTNITLALGNIIGEWH